MLHSTDSDKSKTDTTCIPIEYKIDVFRESHHCLLMVHGGPGMSSSYFSQAVHALKKNLSVVCYDQGQAQDYTLNGLLKELLWVVDDLILKGKNITLLGHSFGAALVLEFYRCFPLKVNKLILCSWIFDNSFTDFRNRLFQQKELLEFVLEKTKKIGAYEDPNEHYRETCLAWLPLYFPEQTQEIGRNILSKIKYNAALRDNLYSEFINPLNLKRVVESITIPTLSIVGSNDGITLPGYVKQGALLNTKFIIHEEVSNNGHFPFIDDCNKFTEIITKFVFSKLKWS